MAKQPKETKSKPKQSKSQRSKKLQNRPPANIKEVKQMTAE
jgi:hypothetical protein